MAVRISAEARSVAADAIAALVDGGVLRLYTGTQPAGPDEEPTGTLLAELDLEDPAFAAAVAGAASLDTTPELTTTGLADGDVGWFRVCSAAQAAGEGLGVLDGAVTVSGGGGELTLNTLAVESGVPVTVTAGVVTMPAAP